MKKRQIEAVLGMLGLNSEAISSLIARVCERYSDLYSNVIVATLRHPKECCEVVLAAQGLFAALVRLDKAAGLQSILTSEAAKFEALGESAEMKKIQEMVEMAVRADDADADLMGSAWN